MKINVIDTEKLQEVINAAQKNCKVRLLETSRLHDAVERAEEKLAKMNIPRKYWVGSSIILQPEKVPHAYTRKGHAEGTFGIIERMPTGWFLVDIRRGWSGSAQYGAAEKERLVLGEDARAARPDEFVL